MVLFVFCPCLLQITTARAETRALIVASERGRISVQLGRARGKYGQPKNCAILYFSVAYATQNSYWLRFKLIDNLMF